MGIVLFLFLYLVTFACPAPIHPTTTTLPEAEPTAERQAEHTLEAELFPKSELKPEPELNPEPEPEISLESEPELEPKTSFERLGREPRSLSANLMWLQKRVQQFIRKIKLC